MWIKGKNEIGTRHLINLDKIIEIKDLDDDVVRFFEAPGCWTDIVKSSIKEVDVHLTTEIIYGK